MLNPSTIAIIKSTVPVLEVHGTAITKRFYELLFTNHPELLNIFNHANQRQGKQSGALANAVYAAAANIDRLEQIIPVVKQIGHKHRALGIKPEHYPIVGEHLLIAIKDVLGDAATDEIIGAWAEAYGVIADAFIGVEAEMYAQAAGQLGGWDGFRKFIVTRKEQESSVITSFYLRPADGQAIASFLPGQYITVRANVPGSANTHLRHYSLSDAPGLSYYRITVKREAGTEPQQPAGIVSNYLHDQVHVGDALDISAPAGDFTIDPANGSDAPVVLISGGVGLTPMVSMLNTIAAQQPDRSVTYIHAAINSELHAMRDHVTALTEQLAPLTSYVCYASPIAGDRCDHEGLIDAAWLQSILPAATLHTGEFYFCGPTPFMKAVNHALKQLGVSPDRIHYEFFGPAGSLEA
ncbi:NO-inducible flavohemoprotein [Paenibacillus guangzhouensis]|uniref:NO-inducible flavohemoprotein n=1 Tax=Paenibacillus guangzhouensis TaxID=1473112 RepID=UPI001266E199|nr:NO-inducible flavohemoprotein [Paenibacillus guangzhouensis]